MIDVKIKLDPVCDGIVKDTEKASAEMCLIIGTNGECRFVNVDEATNIMEKLAGDTGVDFINHTPYAMAYNKRKTVLIDGSRFLIGSVLIVNLFDGIVMSDEDIDEAIKLFTSRLVRIKLGPDQDVIAYEL